MALVLHGLFSATEALCSIFVSVYLWVNSLDFGLVCRHYLAVYTVTPIVFIFAGWYSAARDRLHVYRLGLASYIAYYGALLVLREQSPDHAVALGVLLGITWGLYWAGANTFNFDVTRAGKREYYFGLLTASTGAAKLLAPMIGGLIIHLAGVADAGYRRVFIMVIILYAVCFALSFLMPSDATRRPFRIRRALFPGKDQRDWRLIMLAAASMAGAYTIFNFLLGLVMYMQTGSELSVGGFASFQALAGIAVAYLLGRLIVPRTRRAFMWWGVVLLAAAGALVAVRLTLFTLVVFGFLRSVANPMFGIAHSGLRLDIIEHCAEEKAQRIEYLSAWEVPLAVGRIAMMLLMMLLYSMFHGSDVGLRVILFVLCAVRFLTYIILSQTSPVRDEA